MFNQKSIKFRILIGFIVVLTIGAISSGYGLLSITKVGTELSTIVHDDIPLTNMLSEITSKQLEQAVLLERVLRYSQITTDVSDSQSALEKTERQFMEISEEVEKELKKFDEKTNEAIEANSDASTKAKFAKIKLSGEELESEHKNYSSHVEKIFRLINTGQSQNIGMAVKDVLEEEEKLDTGLEELLTELGKFTEESAGVAEQHEQNAVATMTIMTLIGIAVGMLLSFLIANGITGPIKKCMLAMNDIAEGEGDLTQRLDASGKDEIAQLAAAFNQFAEKMHHVMVEVKSSTSSISIAAQQVSVGNLDLSQRTEEQASSLEETASSMEEMTSTVRQNADNSKQANQLAKSARDQAVTGGEVVKHAVEAMTEINSSSNKIADIISVVEEIAFQTNLLALNAAVEAARAGEQGRGFAVVASEVRVLAGRSADAAKEIKTLIEDSVSKVKAGSELVDKSGETLQEIVGSVKKVADIISEISAASQEQSAGIEQVNKAVMQMDEMTQMNASLVEESAAASRSMEEQTSLLLKLMGFFKLDESIRAEIASASADSRIHNTGKMPRENSKISNFANAGNHTFNTGKIKSGSPNVRSKKDDNDGDWEDF